MNLHPKRKCKCSEHRGDEPWHGSKSGYKRHFCRCVECKSWRNAEQRRYRSTPRGAALHHAKKIAYRERNILAARARSRANNERYRQIAPNLRPRAPWSPAEDAVALDPTLTILQAATIIGRSVSAVGNRRQRIRKAESVGPQLTTIKAPGFDGPWILIHAKDLAEAERIIDTLTPNITKSLV